MQIGSIQGGSANLTIQQAQPAKAAKASPLAYYDPADTNQDGVVSAAEALAYSLEHPELAILKAANAASTNGAGNLSAQYTQNGTVNPAAQTRNGFLDLNA
jgi:hypothetical protein